MLLINFRPKDYFELMQFTGLTDKNGVDIYEGDIIAFTSEYKEAVTDLGEGPDYNYNQIKEVLYFDGCFGVNSDNDNWFSKEFISLKYIKKVFDRDSDSSIEVIGNIYENPDLLEK